MATDEVTKFRRRVGDHVKSDSDIITVVAPDKSFNLRYSNVFDVTVYRNGVIVTDYEVEQHIGMITFDSVLAVDDELRIDYSYAAYTDTEITEMIVEYGFDNAVVEVITELLADSARMYDYTSGATDEKLSQQFDHLKQLYELYSKQAVGFTNGSGAKIGSVRVGRRIHERYRSYTYEPEDLSRKDI